MVVKVLLTLSCLAIGLSLKHHEVTTPTNNSVIQIVDDIASVPQFSQSQVMYSTNHGCRLRSKRFISDGLCTSPKPISEVVCAESCVTPSHMHIHNSQHAVIKNQTSKHAVRRRKYMTKWHCEDMGIRRRRVKLLCRDGTVHSYSIRVVTSCRCTPHNKINSTNNN